MKVPGWTLPLSAVLAAVVPAAYSADRPCEKLVGLLATDFVYRVANSQLARVEIRRCSPEDSATIQLVAWRTGGAHPALVVNTDDFGVVQAVARANVFVVETGGATRDQVFVIVYSQGEPKLALKRVTKGTARIKVGPAAIDLDIEGIYAGDNPPRTESLHFALDLDGTRPK